MLLSPVEARNAISTKWNMPEYADFDREVYVYDDITDEDIWDYHIELEMGVVKMTQQIYEDKILKM